MSPPHVVKRPWIVPETLQVSAMDCGPVALHTLLRALGRSSSYPRLRERCQTDLDGTSIDQLEDAAGELGLEVEQVLLPPEHLLLEAPSNLPAIVVTQHPDGATHFVVAWNQRWGFVQVMDPARGRRWVRRRDFLAECFRHRQRVPSSVWLEWAQSEEFRLGLAARLASLGISEDQTTSFLQDLSRADDWQHPALLDAAARCLASLVDLGLVPRRSVAELLRHLWVTGREDPATIPDAYWSVTHPHVAVDGLPSDGGSTLDEDQVAVAGVVLLRVRRVPVDEPTAEAPTEEDAPVDRMPWPTLLAPLRNQGRFGLFLLGALTVAGSLATLAEALLFRGLIEASEWLQTPQQRRVALLALLVLVLTSLTIHGLGRGRALALGTRLEIGLRSRLGHKIRRLSDAFFASRLVSDMAERAHVLHRLRGLPPLALRGLEATVRLLCTAVALSLLAPELTPWIWAGVLLLLGFPQIIRSWQQERDLRLRTHAGALGRFQIDALLGILPLRAHGGERALAQRHEARLAEWCRAGRALLRSTVLGQAAVYTMGYGLAGLLVWRFCLESPRDPRTLLVVYWALRLPAYGERFAEAVRRFPPLRSVLLRVAEPLSAPDEVAIAPAASRTSSLEPSASEGSSLDRGSEGVEAPNGAAFVATQLTVRSGDQTRLNRLTFELQAGEQVAIIGPSGSGKSTLVATLLGWHAANSGSLCLDGHPLNPRRAVEIRRSTVWVDSAVRLWNRSLLENILYGNSGADRAFAAQCIAEAELSTLLATLPQGSSTLLGEGGTRVSGGEGQRIRLARGWNRPDARLLLLDEAFRGIDRRRSRRLLDRMRSAWPEATLVCITHDLALARTFPRVLVLEAGSIIEDGSPTELMARTDGYLQRLATTHPLPTHAWRRLVLESGTLREIDS